MPFGTGTNKCLKIHPLGTKMDPLGDSDFFVNAQELDSIKHLSNSENFDLLIHNQRDQKFLGACPQLCLVFYFRRGRVILHLMMLPSPSSSRTKAYKKPSLIFRLSAESNFKSSGNLISP